jgi:pimeloyl-ACP methyl ester carboxylesterase
MISGKLITAKASDGFILHGLLSESEKKRDVGILHLHGSYGNFYENFFLENLGRALPEMGVGFLAVNTRGHDYYSDLKRDGKEGIESVRIGGIREVFQDCVNDIDGWLGFLRSMGFKRIVLEGHSLGAMKVIFYARRHSGDLSGLALISPPDNFGLQYAEWGSRFEGDLKLARDLVADDKGETLMPAEAYYDPITARSFLSLLGTPEDTGMFTYSDVELMKRAGMSSLQLPILATFATKGEAVVHPVDECISALRSAVGKPDLLSTAIIEGANHSYHFRGEELATAICRWLGDRFGAVDSQQ